MSEQLRFEQLIRQRSAVYRKERPLTPPALCMYGPSDQVFSRAALAQQQDRSGIGSRYLLHRFGKLSHQRRPADQLDVGELPTMLLAQHGHFVTQSAGLERLLDCDQKVVCIQRFFQEVVGARLEGLHGGFDFAVRRHDDDDEISVHAAEDTQ